MKSLVNIAFVFFVMLFFTSCASVDKRNMDANKKYALQVSFESDFYNNNFIDTTIFSKPIYKNTEPIKKEFDKYINHYTLKVKEGEITITAISEFERTFSKTMIVHSDTNIIFSNKDFTYQFVLKDKWNDELKLNDIDTFEILISNGSCINTNDFISSRKIACFKNGNDITVRYTEQTRGGAENKRLYKIKTMDETFINELQLFYNAVKDKKEHPAHLQSTSNAYMHIRLGNDIFKITDPNFSIWDNYIDLIEYIKKH